MKGLGIGVSCVVQKGHPAILDSLSRTVIGHDFFFFSGAEERYNFGRDPLRYCRALTDPVTLRRFSPTKKSPHLEYHGRPYYFASDSTRAVFATMPDSFAIRKGM